MRSVSYPKWLNFIWFQCILFFAILGREQTQWLLLGLLLKHLALSKRWKTEMKVMLMCASVGVALESLFTWQGVFQSEARREFSIVKPSTLGSILSNTKTS